MTTTPSGLPPSFGELKPLVEGELARRLDSCEAPGELLEAMEYAVLGGGKRLRPVMTLLSSRLCCGRVEPALRAAAALEMIHAYSLIHDDLPCMDDDDMRRGKPTTHRVFGEALAVLAGDALQALAFESVTDSPVDSADVVRMTAALAKAAGAAGMVGGQTLDIRGDAVDADDLAAIDSKKTGALFEAAMIMGGIAGGASDRELAGLRDYAESFGLVFQIADDLLDLTGDPEKTGRYRGSDSDAGRKTYPNLLGIESSRSRMQSALERGLSALKSFGDSAQDLEALLVFAASREG
ncbi:MAG: polyprenyl synthetase family protein [Bacillota bacterium]